MAGKRYAILIASSKYPDEPGLAPLRCPENDVDALNEVLSSPDFGQFTETFVLKNKPSYEILRGIETVLANAGKDDLVLVYFSGHGKTDIFDQLYLATLDTNLKALGSTSIPLERLRSFFEHYYEVRSKILILDCCYSGAAGKAFAKGGSVDDQLQIMAKGQGTFIMTASTSAQIAVENPGDDHSLFTKHLLKGIRSGEADRDEDGFVDIHELYQHVHEKVRAEGAQEPMKWDINAKGRMIIAKIPKAPKEPQLREPKSRLFELAAQGQLIDDIVFEAVNVLSIPKQEMTARDRECSLLIERLVDGRLSPADFVKSWLKTSFVPEKPPVPALPVWKNKVLPAVAAVLVVGAALYFMPVSPVVPSPSEEARSEPPVVAPQKPPAKPAPKQRAIHVEPRQIPDIGKISIPQPIVLPEKPSQNASPQGGRTIGQYIDHGDGTITDTASGLMWKRCSEGLSGVNCEQGKTEQYYWDDAVKRFKDVKYADYSDWRLPTLAELKTLVYCSKGKYKNGDCKEGSEPPTINQQAFPNTEASSVWSGSPDDVNSGYAGRVNFYYGHFSINSNLFDHAVRLVRGGQ